MLALLNGHILTQIDDKSTLSIGADKYLKADIDYEFMMNFNCNGNELDTVV